MPERDRQAQCDQHAAEGGLVLHLFDAATEPPADGKHGPLGVDHTGRVPIDYLYQAEQWMIDMPSFNPEVIRGELHRSGQIIARWRKNDAGKFEPYEQG